MQEVDPATERIEFPIPVKNCDSKPIRILGMRSNCSCTQANLPIEIPPLESRDVIVSIAIGSLLLTEGKVAKEVYLIHDRGDRGIRVTLIAQTSEGD